MSRIRKQRRGSSVLQPAEPIDLPTAQSAFSIVRPHITRLLALWVLALAAYSNSFQSGMVLDNALVILKDPRIRAVTAQNLGLILNKDYWYSNLTSMVYRPLTTFSYLVNWAILGNGPHPAAYHVVNFALHAANIALVYWLGLVVFEETAAALSLAGIWGVHPLLTEAVTNVVGRADLLAAFGVLTGLLCHIANRSATGRRRLAWTCGLALAAAIGIFSKENAAVLPGVMLLCDLAWADRARWRERVTGYLAVAAPFAVYFYLRIRMLAQNPAGVVPFLDNPLVGTDFWTAKLAAVKVIGKFMWLAVWPSRLSADYSYNAVRLPAWRLDWSSLSAWIALAVCVAAVAIALRCYRSRKPVFFFIAFFFAALSPTANVVFFAGAIMAERFMYLPLIGVVGCAVLLIQAALRRLPLKSLPRPRVYWATMGLLFVACGARTYARNFDWRDERSLWISAVHAYPSSFRANSALASALLAGGVAELDQAIRAADHSLAILDGLPPDQSNAQAYATAAAVYRVKGDQLGAAGGAYWYQKALTALLTGQRVDLAGTREMDQLNAAQGKKVVVIGWPPLYLEFGRIYLRLSDPQKALESLSYGRVRRSDAEFSEEMSRAWLAQGDWERAAVSLTEGLVMDPDAQKLALDLLDLYRQKSSQSCAVTSAGAQASINLGCPMVHNHVCQASRNVAASYRQIGLAEKATATAQSAIQSLGCPAELFR